MCQSAQDVDAEAQRCGWWGWQEGSRPEDMLVYHCGCDFGHMTYIALQADDPEYYRRRCDFIRSCTATGS
jgi:hypothetical protein